MQLRVVGAGLGRTGTNSLKLALERLLGAPCYHMLELFSHLDQVPVWQRAVDGEPVDWDALFDGYAAAVDWPAAAFWSELAAASPDAIVLLSTRADADTWWRSMKDTILASFERGMPPGHPLDEWGQMLGRLMRSRHPGWTDLNDRADGIAEYERHNAAVRTGTPPGRLVEWQPGDGWEPLCAALGLPVPDEPFPRTNTTEEFRVRAGLDAYG